MVEKVSNLGIQVDSKSVLLAKQRLKAMGKAFGKVQEGQKKVKFGQKYTNIIKKLDTITDSAILAGNSFRGIREAQLTIRFGPKYTNITKKLKKIAKSANIASKAMKRLGVSVKESKLQIASPIAAPKITKFSSKQSVAGMKSISKQVKLVVSSFKLLSRSAMSTGLKVSAFVNKANRSLKRLVVTAEKLALAFGQIRLAQSRIRFGPKWDKINDTMRRLNVNSKRVVGNLNRINAASNRGAAAMGAYGRASGGAGRESAAAMRIARGQMTLTGVVLGGLRNQIGQLAVAWLGFRAVVEAFRLSGQYQGLHNLMKATGASTATATKNLKEITSIAIRTRAPLEATAKLFQRAKLSAKELGATHKDILRFTENIGLALAMAGGTVEESRGAILQLSQALGSVLVRGEEFNSIMTGALPIAQAAARGIERFGGSVSALRAAIVLGKVTSKEFFEAILSQTEILDTLFSRTSVTIAQGFFVMQTGFTSFIGQMDKAAGVSNSLGRAMRALGVMMFNATGPAVDFITKHIDTLKGAIVFLASVLGLKLVGVIVKVLAPSLIRLQVNIFRTSLRLNRMTARAVTSALSLQHLGFKAWFAAGGMRAGAIASGLFAKGIRFVGAATIFLGRAIRTVPFLALLAIGAEILVWVFNLIGKFFTLAKAVGGFGKAFSMVWDVVKEYYGRISAGTDKFMAKMRIGWIHTRIFMIEGLNYNLERWHHFFQSVTKKFAGFGAGIGVILDSMSLRMSYIVSGMKLNWLTFKTKMIGIMNTIGESVHTGTQNISKYFTAAYEVVKVVWGLLPQIFENIMTNINVKISNGLNTLLNTSKKLMNFAIEGANKLGLGLPKFIIEGTETLDEVEESSASITDKIKKAWSDSISDNQFTPYTKFMKEELDSALDDMKFYKTFIDTMDAIYKSRADNEITLGSRVTEAYEKAISDFTAKPFEPAFNGAKAALEGKLFVERMNIVLAQIEIDKPLKSIQAIKDAMEEYRKSLEETDIDFNLDDLPPGLDALAKAAKNLADTIRSNLVSAVQQVGDAFTDFIFRGLKDFKSFAKSIVSTFKNLLKEMVSMAVKRNLLVKLGFTSDGKGGVTGGAKANSIAAKLERHFAKLVSGGGVRSGGRREGGEEEGGGNWFKRLFGGGDGKTYLQRYLGLEGKNESNSDILTRIDANRAQNGQAGGGVVGVINALSSAVSFITGGFATAAASIGATFITGATAIFGATGAVVSTAIVGALSAIALPLLAIAAVFSFFKKSRKITDTRIEVTFNKDSVDARTSKDITTKRFWGLSKKRTTEYKKVDDEFGQILAEFNIKSRASINALGAAFGAENALDKFQFRIKFSTEGLSAEEINKRVQQEFEAMTEAMARLIVGSEEFVREGETFVDAAKRMAESISVVNSNFDRLGLRMFDITREGANTASVLAEILGGIQGFTSSIDYYFKNFFDKSEQLEINTRSLTKALAALGVDAIPASKIAFRGLIQQMQEIGNTGAVGVLLKIAPLFIEIAGAANEAANANARLFRTRADEVFANSGSVRPFTRDGSGERIHSTAETRDENLLREILYELRNGNVTISQNTHRSARILDRMERKDDALT